MSNFITPLDFRDFIESRLIRRLYIGIVEGENATDYNELQVGLFNARPDVHERSMGVFGFMMSSSGWDYRVGDKKTFNIPKFVDMYDNYSLELYSAVEWMDDFFAHDLFQEYIEQTDSGYAQLDGQNLDVSLFLEIELNDIYICYSLSNGCSSELFKFNICPHRTTVSQSESYLFPVEL